MTKCIKRI